MSMKSFSLTTQVLLKIMLISQTNKSSSNSFIIAIKSNKNSNNSKMTTTRHTKGIYHYKTDCSCFNKCICPTCLLLCAIIIPIGIFIGGCFTVLEGIETAEYGDSFNIEGICTIKSSNVIEMTCTKKTKCCHAPGSCYDCRRTYDCSETTVIYYINHDNDTSFPCTQNYEFKKVYSCKCYGEKPGQTSKCWANEECHNIYLDTTNEHHTNSGWIYFGAAIVFLVSFCVGGTCYCATFSSDNCMNGNSYQSIFNSFQMDLKHECNNCMNGKNKFYKHQWTIIMNECDRFDYIMSNWCRKYCNHGYDLINDGMLCYDIESVIYDYTYK
eukprot:95658_1